MKSPGDLWNELGEIPEEELLHVLTKLYSLYEGQLGRSPGNDEAVRFFSNLDTAISQTAGCNLNRR